MQELKYSALLLLKIIAVLLITTIIPLIFLFYPILALIVPVYFLIVLITLKICKNKIIQFVFQILYFPFSLVSKILNNTFPLILIMMNVILYIGLPLIIVANSSLFLKLLKTPINFELKLYLSFLTSYVFYITFNKVILKFIEKNSPARYKTSQKLKPYNIKEISEYLLSKENMRFLIYTFNFFAIIFINIYKFQELSFYDTILLLERPIIQSLVTFIAFDRAIILLKDLKFKPSEFYKKIEIGIQNKKDSLK
ncbi:hypothetical protein [Myroides sp. TSA_177.3]|uniref:hypothetical protein n=1 Tax=Myroides sp. TSA_177.3 TaxID=3415650 RepID=UPI0040456CDC